MEKVKRPHRITFRVSNMELLALESITGDGKISKTIRTIIKTSDKFRKAYKQLNQTLKKEVNDESIRS